MTFVPKLKANECKVPSSDSANSEHFSSPACNGVDGFSCLVGSGGWGGPGGGWLAEARFVSRVSLAQRIRLLVFIGPCSDGLFLVVCEFGIMILADKVKKGGMLFEVGFNSRFKFNLTLLEGKLLD